MYVVFSACSPKDIETVEVTLNGTPYTLTLTDEKTRTYTVAGGIDPILVRGAWLTASAANARIACKVPPSRVETSKNGADCELTFLVPCEPFWRVSIDSEAKGDEFNFYKETKANSLFTCGARKIVRSDQSLRTTRTVIGKIGLTEWIVIVLPDADGKPVEYEFDSGKLEEFGDPAKLSEIGPRGSGNKAPTQAARYCREDLGKQTKDLLISRHNESKKP